MASGVAGVCPSVCRNAAPVRGCGAREALGGGSHAVISRPRNTRRALKLAARRGPATTVAAVGDAQWLVTQGTAAAVILGGFWVSGDLQKVIADFTGGEPGDGDVCPMCNGSGQTSCACTRWSDDNEGCGNCSYTGQSICPACRGGGRPVRVTLEIPVEQDDPSAGFQDRGGDSSHSSHSRLQQPLSSFNRTLTWAAPVVAEQQPLFGPGVGVRGGGGGGVAEPAADLQQLLSGEKMLRLLSELPLHVSKGVERSEVVTEPRSASKEGKDGDDPSSSKDDEFYAQSGEAIRTLREDYPHMLARAPRWGIYREDIGLVDKTGSFGRQGILATNMAEYKRVFKWMRTIAGVLFSQCSLDVQRIWSPLGSSGVRTIRVRWCVRAKIRIVENMGVDTVHFDGISEYSLDEKGFIYQHSITDLDWDVAQMGERVVSIVSALQRGTVVQQPGLGSGQWFKNPPGL